MLHSAERGPVLVYLLKIQKVRFANICTVVDQNRLMCMFHKSDSKFTLNVPSLPQNAVTALSEMADKDIMGSDVRSPAACLGTPVQHLPSPPDPTQHLRVQPQI